MKTRQIVIEGPEKILLAEKTDESAFARELRVLAAVKLFALGRPSLQACKGLSSYWS